MSRAHSFFQKTTAIVCAVLLPVMVGWAQQPYQPQSYPQQAPPPVASQPGQAPLLSPAQLDDLVAPVALYPDPLLAQLLAASTYPLEVVEAQQWMQQNPNLRGEQLVNAARQQSWDPSVQAMVAFPDVMTLLTRDVQWTTDLGNAFLAQQADVMSAVQRMRARAEQNGRLQSNAQQRVTGQYDDGQGEIDIQPTDPQVIYVPTYNPVYVWGPPVYGYYPPLWYPPVSFGFGFGPGIFLGGLFGGFGGFGGWGWGFNWASRGLFVNGLFFDHFGFRRDFDFHRGFGGDRAWWAHNPEHRGGLGYPNRAVAQRFGSPSRIEAARNGVRGFENRGGAGFANRGFGGAGFANRGTENRGFGGAGFANRGTENRGFGGAGFANRGAENRGFNQGREAGGARSLSNPARSNGGWQSFNRGGEQRSFGSSSAFGSSSGRAGGAQGFQQSRGMESRGLGQSGFRQPAGPRGFEQGNRGSAGMQNFSRGFSNNNRSFAPSQQRFSAPSQHFSAPQQFSAPSQHFSAPRMSGGGGGGGHFSAPRGFSGGGGGGHMGGGGGGRVGGGGGGHAGGGGGHRH